MVHGHSMLNLIKCIGFFLYHEHILITISRMSFVPSCNDLLNSLPLYLYTAKRLEPVMTMLTQLVHSTLNKVLMVYIMARNHMIQRHQNSIFVI